MSELPQFEAIDWYTIKGVGQMAAVALDRDTSDFAHLVGKEVLIDGVAYRVRAVERFAHCSPWRAGEQIALAVVAVPSVPVT
jgi:hypothetical protein